jgi:hypothetical protein
MVDLIIWLIVGAAARWIAGIVIKGVGFGPLGNIIVGILGLSELERTAAVDDKKPQPSIWHRP